MNRATTASSIIFSLVVNVGAAFAQNAESPAIQGQRLENVQALLGPPIAESIEGSVTTLSYDTSVGRLTVYVQRGTVSLYRPPRRLPAPPTVDQKPKDLARQARRLYEAGD